MAKLEIFLKQTEAEYKSFVKGAGDENVLNGLETNLIRAASDFHWAHFVCSFLDSSGKLTAEKEKELIVTLDDMILKKSAVISDEVIPPLLEFMRFALMGAFHLNKLATGFRVSQAGEMSRNTGSLKRKRIVERMSQGCSAEKKRRFAVSKLAESLKSLGKQSVRSQLRILETHVVVEKPTHRSVSLVKELSEDAREYLKTSCGYSNEDIHVLMMKISQLKE